MSTPSLGIPTFTMRELLEAGVHFGHNTRRWNPKMEQYIFGVRHNTHIIDLQQTVPMLSRALELIVKTAEAGGTILFVGTKHQASDRIKEAAKRCAQPYVNHRWLGGMLTNWKTISQSIKHMKEIEKILENPAESGLTKKELLNIEREHEKLERAVGGIREMNGKPDLMFVIDTNKEAIAIKEAKVLGIPVVAVVDTNCDPDHIDYPIPGNDDAQRAIDTYCRLVCDAVLEGIQREVAATGADVREDRHSRKSSEEVKSDDSKAGSDETPSKRGEAPDEKSAKVKVEVKKKKGVKSKKDSDTEADSETSEGSEESETMIADDKKAAHA